MENEMMFSLKSPAPAATAIEESTGSEIAFVVYGTPVPQGSMRAFVPKGWQRPVITADNKKTKPWRQEIAAVALEAMKGWQMFEGPVSLCATFYFERPKSLKKSVRSKITKPDLSKLIRAAEDALTGIVYKDDAQIWNVTASKMFGSPARMEIIIYGRNHNETR